jgi:predicted nucleic-acid-binding protein
MLLRLILADDEIQGPLAKELVERPESVAIRLHSLHELVWGLASRSAMIRTDIAASIRAIIATGNFVANRSAVTAGLAALDEGGDVRMA